MKTILLIDDCIDYREVTANLLSETGYDVWEAGSPMEALPLLKSEKFDLIVCDLHMPFASDEDQKDFVYSYEVGVKTIQELKELFPAVQIIAMSNTSSTDLKRITRFLDPIPAYTKPVHYQDVVDIIDSHLTPGGVAIIQ